MIKVFLTNTRDDYYAVGEYNEKTNELKVLKNSRVCLNISSTWTFNPERIIKSRVGKLDKDILIEDITFKSPSTAGNFVTGKSTDGLTAWKDENGISIKKYKINEEKTNNE